MKTPADNTVERLSEELRRPPFNLWLAPHAVTVDEEAKTVVVKLDYRPELSHDPTAPYFHGGVISALADIVGHASVAVWHGRSAPTISLNLNYLRPAVGPVLIAKGQLRRLGRSVSTADVEVFDGDALVALGRGVFSTLEKK